MLLYVIGSDLEGAGLATHNLLQVLNSNFSADGDIRFVVLTGGSDSRWMLSREYLYDPKTKESPLRGISPKYNQLWEAKGADSTESHEGTALKSKLVLLDGNGITGTGDEAVESNDELMSEYADFYIASAETEPGFGQDYRGWVSAIGSDPNCSTFELGKIIREALEREEQGVFEQLRQDGNKVCADDEDRQDSCHTC